MGLTVIDLDIKNLPLEDFMRAMGYEPVNRNANLLTFKSPYSAKGNIVVNTDANGWYDTAQPEKLYGGREADGNIVLASPVRNANQPKPEPPIRKRGMRL